MSKKFATVVAALAVGPVGLLLPLSPANASLATAPVLRSFEAMSGSTFFPTPDGYKDGVTFRFNIDRPYTTRGAPCRESWTVTVRNADGRIVASKTDTKPSANGEIYAWTWNGKGRTGKPVRVGTYKVTLTARNSETGASAGKRTIRVHAKATRYKIGTITKAGRQTSARHIDSDSWGIREGGIFGRRGAFGKQTKGMLRLSAWSHNVNHGVRVHYRFKLPANTVSVTKQIVGYAKYHDGRPEQRSIHLNRVNNRTYEVQVFVGGYGYREVNQVKITYKAVR